MKKCILLVFFLCLSLNAQGKQGDGLVGHYYQGYSLVGGVISFNTLNEAFSRVDTVINFWNGSSGFRWQPVAGYGDYYSVSWQGFIYIEQTGVYGFGTISDDGSQIFVDDSMIVNNGESQWYDWEDNIGEGDTSGVQFEPLILERGYHKFSVLFYENASYDGIELWWIKPSGIDSSDIPWYGKNFHSTPPVFNPNTNWELIPKQVLYSSHNFKPVAMTDIVDVKEDSMITFYPLNNDYDPDSNLVILTGYDSPLHGSLSVTDSSFTYVPDENFFGPDSFQYIIRDSLNEADTGLVVINVIGVNDAPESFSLVSPAEGITLDSLSQEITFIWRKSEDVDGDLLSYSMQIFNDKQDTLITLAEDSLYVFKGSLFFKPETEYSWTVGVSDGFISVNADTFHFSTPAASGISSLEEVPLQFALLQNFPNPFNPVTVVGYRLSAVSEVELTVYNLIGQKVATLVSEKQNAGSYQVEWDASQYASGVYYYQLQAGDYRQVRKMILIK